MSNAPSVFPPLSEVLEKGKGKSRDFKFLSPDNTWNKDGLLASFDSETDKMIKCAASGVPLYFITDAGQEIYLESFGYCDINGKPYHRDYLAIPGDTDKEKSPIQHLGRISKEEAKKPLTSAELAIIRKEHGL